MLLGLKMSVLNLWFYKTKRRFEKMRHLTESASLPPSPPPTTYQSPLHTSCCISHLPRSCCRFHHSRRMWICGTSCPEGRSTSGWSWPDTDRCGAASCTRLRKRRTGRWLHLLTEGVSLPWRPLQNWNDADLSPDSRWCSADGWRSGSLRKRKRKRMVRCVNSEPLCWNIFPFSTFGRTQTFSKDPKHSFINGRPGP